MPSDRSATAPAPVSTAGHRLRRDALRILAEKFERTTLSPTEAENLLAGYGTIAGSLQAVRRQRRRARFSGRLKEVLRTGIGIRQLRWLSGALALSEIVLIGLFLFRIGFSINSAGWLRHIDPIAVAYLTASSLVVLVLAWCWRALGRGSGSHL